MIRISCTNCKTVLSIDDAFAGGVCRCQHCGTIQTVPAHARDAAEVGVAGQSMGGSKSLYQHGDARTGTGLDELAGIVVSSGLSSSRLTKPPARSNVQVVRQNLMPLIVGGGILVAILIVIIIFLATRNSQPSAPSSGAGTDSSIEQSNAGGAAAPVVNSPNFCNTKLDGTAVIYLLDCGEATKDCLGELKDATIKSARSLGSDHKFQILFWNNGTDGAYPEDTTTYATKESVDAAQKAIDEVYAYGRTSIDAALQKAVAQHPDELVVATGKGYELDNGWLDGVLNVRGSAPVKIITYNLGGDGECAPLKRLAEKTGGSYHEANKSQLHAFGE